MSKLPNILVLGVSGMLGRAVFRYFHNKHPLTTYGTSRTGLNNQMICFFDAKKSKTGLKAFKNRNYGYFINCIGILKGTSSKEDMSVVNSNFPIILDRYCEENGIKLIHISTDAVFSNLSGIADEKTKPNPNDYYGRSKLMGEVKMAGINIRTSLLGFSSIKHKGFLESVLQNRNKETVGFVNQIWSGSTVLQIAQFIEWLISENNFSDLLKKTKVIHFAPLGPITKYKILKTFSKLTHNGRIIKGKGPKQNRVLKTIYVEEIELKRYTKTLEEAFKELIIFDHDYTKTYKN